MEDPARAADVSAVAPALVEQWAREAGMYEVGVRVQSDAAMVRFARLAFEAGRAKGLEEAKLACEAEDLEGPPKYAEDRAYCRAIQDCIDAIEALRSLAPAVPI